MGYTHYWYVNRAGDQGLWLDALRQAKLIVDAAPKRAPLGDAFGDGVPRIGDDGIFFNGVGADGHETCALWADVTRAWAPDMTKPWAFNFCKTAAKPYDVVVTAVLAAIQDIVGVENVLVTSDGETADWLDGCSLASRVLDRVILPPPAVHDYGAHREHPAINDTILKLEGA